MLALAFVPEADVISAWERLMQLPNKTVPLSSPLASYFERTYIGERKRTGRKTPVIPISIWNSYELLADELPRTTNAVEGWHNRFHQAVGACHLGFYRFCDKVRKEQGKQEKVLEDITKGVFFPRNGNTSSALNDYRIWPKIIRQIWTASTTCVALQ